VGQNGQAYAIAAVAGFGVEAALVDLGGVGRGEHLHEGFVGVALLQRRMQPCTIDLRLEQAGVERDLHTHAAAKGAHRGHEVGVVSQAPMLHHLGDVLVPGLQRVGRFVGERAQVPVRVLPAVDQGPTAAAVARQGVDRQRCRGRQQPRVGQGTQQERGAGRVAARIADQPGRANGIALAGYQLRQPVGPAGGDPVRRAAVDHARVAALDEGDRLPRRSVWQAQDRHVTGPQELRAGRRILALVGVDLQQLQVLARPE